VCAVAGVCHNKLVLTAAASPELGKSYDEVTQMLEAAQNYTMIFK
jgi:hypothetical protein